MTVYYVDDGGSATAPYDTWAKAATSLSALDDAVALASGDIVYIGHNHVCQYTHAASRTITGPTSGLPCIIISATQGSNPPTYQASTTDQVDTSEGAYSLTFDGSFALYGVRMKSGANIALAADSNELVYLDACVLAPGANGSVQNSQSAGYINARNLTIDLTADGTTTRSGAVINAGASTVDSYIHGLSFVNAGYRTGVVIDAAGSGFAITVTGADFSGFTNATLCELVNGNSLPTVVLANCKTPATWAPAVAFSSTWYSSRIDMTNVGPDDAPTYAYRQTASGQLISTSSIYRTNGAQIADTHCAWLITTTAGCGESAPFYTPWWYGRINSTGSKTFDTYITNDTADLTDAEAWLEVEYKDESGEAIWQLASDQRVITATAVAQTDDTASTWNGTGPAFTYKQKLSVTATVNQTGQYRARVAIGKASIAGSSYLYVDPGCVVT